MSFETRVRAVTHNMPNHNVQIQSSNQISPTDMPRENPNNIYLTADICNNLLASYGISYKIKNLELFQRAFVHTSYLIDDPNSPDVPNNQNSRTASNAGSTTGSNSGSTAGPTSGLKTAKPSKNPVVPLQPLSYERLEYIGDAILNAATAHYVFERYPSEDEGFMTTLRTKLVRSKTLARITRKLKLHKYILLSLYTDKIINGRNNRNNLEDVFEAWIGALYLDCGSDTGFGICLKFISNVFERWIDMVNMINRDDNYKKNLLEYYQKRFRTEAKYQIISVRGKKPHKVYTMGALSPTGEIIGIGQAKKKVDADQMASKQALIYYGEEVEESEEDSISS